MSILCKIFGHKSVNYADRDQIICSRCHKVLCRKISPEMEAIQKRMLQRMLDNGMLDGVNFNGEELRRKDENN